MQHRLGEEALITYQKRFKAMEGEFLDAVDGFGLPFAAEDDIGRNLTRRKIESLVARGVATRNDGKSLHYGGISPACLACRTGERTESFITSMQCPRNCFFCFNPNQPNYEYYKKHVNPLIDDLEQRHSEGEVYDCLAVTGGEPLLHPDETLGFCRKARSMYPGAHLRLYTSGHGFDERIARRLADAGLDEIRFSVKLEEPPEEVDATMRAIEAAVDVIPKVMVEMPVFPDQKEPMEKLLLRLDAIGAWGINLLELGFPFRNADEFSKRGYSLKPDPYRVIYGYWYSGGLPIAHSEDIALDLLGFAVERGLDLNIHYCSLENRLTSQIYRQNAKAAPLFPLRTFSERDFFLKSAKVFGEAMDVVEDELAKMGCADMSDRLEGPDGFLELPLAIASQIAPRLSVIAWGVSYAVAEADGSYTALKELRLDRVDADSIPLD